MCKKEFIQYWQIFKKLHCQEAGSLSLMSLVYCFAFKRPDEPWRGRGPHDPTSSRLVTPLKAFSQTLKTYTFVLENVFFTKFRTCKRIPGCEGELGFIAKPITSSWFRTQYHYAQHDENEACRLQWNDFYKCFRYRNALATFQTSLQSADNTHN